MVALDVQRLDNLQNIRTVLSVPVVSRSRTAQGPAREFDEARQAIRGYTVNDLSFSGSSEYSEILGSLFQNIRDSARIAQEIASLFTDVGPIRSFQTLDQSILSWRSSQRFTFSLAFLVVETDHQRNTVVAATRLLRTMYPLYGGGFTLLPPSAYSGGSGASAVRGLLREDPVEGEAQPRGTIGVSVGTWFRTPPIFVPIGVNVTLSKIPTDTGRPLWMAATMDLTSYRMNTADEVEGFYSGGR